MGIPIPMKIFTRPNLIRDTGNLTRPNLWVTVGLSIQHCRCVAFFTNCNVCNWVFIKILASPKNLQTITHYHYMSSI